MAVLKHELWRSPDGSTGLCLSGPLGDGFRSLLETDSKLVQVIEGSSHYDVITKYYKIMDWGEYTTEFQRDYEPYPDEWQTVQDSRPS